MNTPVDIVFDDLMSIWSRSSLIAIDLSRLSQGNEYSLQEILFQIYLPRYPQHHSKNWKVLVICLQPVFPYHWNRWCSGQDALVCRFAGVRVWTQQSLMMQRARWKARHPTYQLGIVSYLDSFNKVWDLLFLKLDIYPYESPPTKMSQCRWQLESNVLRPSFLQKAISVTTPVDFVCDLLT